MDALEAEGYRCRAYLVDISERERVYEAAKKVKQEVGNVQVLINNAGIVACRTLWDLSDKAIESTYAVNILSHYWVSISLRWVTNYSIVIACYKRLLSVLDHTCLPAGNDERQQWPHRYGQLGYWTARYVRLHRLQCDQVCLRRLPRVPLLGAEGKAPSSIDSSQALLTFLLRCRLTVTTTST